jgi:hypothetical protein
MEEKRGIGTVYELNLQDFFGSFVGVVKTIVMRTGEFYERMPRTGGLLSPVVFIGVCLAVSGILAAIVTGGHFLIFFKLIIFGLIFSFIGAGILHVIAQKLFEGKGEFEGTYRVVAYAGTVQLLGWIPVVAFLAALYGFYLQIVGLEKVHQITKGQAVVTILIGFVAYLVFFALVGGVLFALR